MSKKYVFNAELLRFERKKTSFRKLLLKYVGIIIFYIASLIFLIWVTIDFWNVPRERVLLFRQEQLQKNYRRLQDQINRIEKSLDVVEKRDNEVYRSIFEVDPIPYDVRIKNITGSNESTDVSQMGKDKLVDLMEIQIAQIQSRLEVQSNSLKEITKYAKTQKGLIQAIPAIQPISNNQLIKFSSGFGYRIDPIYKIAKMHEGVDFSASTGTPIYATADGTVSYAGMKFNGYGNHVIINHGYGYQTLYGHMSRIKARQGAKIKRGAVIGYVGSTGKSTAPHLHYEVWRGGKKVNPIYFFYSDLDESQFEELLKRAQINNQSFD